MSFYPAKINERFLCPANTGEIADSTATAKSASFACGAVLELSLKIENDRITTAKFKAAGCGFLIAAADILCEKIAGRTTGENLNVFALIENELGGFEKRRQHCLELIWETWQATINNYRAARRQAAPAWNGEEALVCSCFGVSEKTIETVIEINSLATVAEVTLVCRAGGGCGSCQPLIQEILDAQENGLRADFAAASEIF